MEVGFTIESPWLFHTFCYCPRWKHHICEANDFAKGNNSTTLQVRTLQYALPLLGNQANVEQKPLTHKGLEKRTLGAP